VFAARERILFRDIAAARRTLWAPICRGQRVGVHGQVDDAHRRSGDVGERI